MPISWIPVRDEGMFHNGKLIGRGQFINDIICIMKKGMFDTKGELNGSNNETIDYSDSANVFIRKGHYQSGKEHGEIMEYIFAKALWSDFTDGVQTTSTRYQHNFNNGVWEATNETKSNKFITSDFKKNNVNRITSFATNEP
jgi:hypothetical protein